LFKILTRASVLFGLGGIYCQPSQISTITVNLTKAANIFQGALG